MAMYMHFLKRFKVDTLGEADYSTFGTNVFYVFARFGDK